MSISEGRSSAKKRRIRGERELLSLRVPYRSGLRVSDAAFWRLCLDNRDLRLIRTPEKELLVMPPAGTESGMQNAGLTGQLWVWNQATDLGVVGDSSAGYSLPNGLIHAPDASWVRKERWLAISPDLRKKFAPICPDFVVELLSPSDSRPEVRRRLLDFMAHGAQLGWLLDPRKAEAEIHRPDRPPETLIRPPTLSGEDVLPGFVLDLRGILFD